MKPFLWIVLFLLGAGALFWGFTGRSPDTVELPSASLISAFEQPTGFARAEGPREWNFPDDFGPHPEYQTEWWYYTGNLQAETGERFGYQLTLFRRALLPAQERRQRDSAWGVEQVYMAHFALSDVAGEKHYAFERFTRGAVGLAGAQADPFQVWLEAWEVVQSANGEYRLKAEQDGIKIDLTLNDIKGPIFHGQQGYSQKGRNPGNASYYFSQTRLETVGTVKVDGKKFPVSGLSWMDHEFSTSALSEGQVGWDWFSIQLDNEAELMVFQIRRSDGSIDPFSSGTWISPTGETTHLERDHFELQVIDSWRSPHSEGEYPAAWKLHIPSLELELDIQPYLADQEMNVSYAYWEGAVQINGSIDGKLISGLGYVELTGYTASMEGEF
jgi:predicted secreted hydrolase